MTATLKCFQRRAAINHLAVESVLDCFVERGRADSVLIKIVDFLLGVHWLAVYFVISGLAAADQTAHRCSLASED
jgi:hypothetical protein